MGNKETIKKLYNEYKKEYLNELYDTPLKFEKENNSYTVFKDNGDKLAFFTFRFEYDIDNSPINHKKYNLDKYWNINWYWDSNLEEDEKTKFNFLKVTSTAFKIVFDFIKENNYPTLLGFSGLGEGHKKVYKHESFIDRWKILLGEKYYTEWKNEKLWIINKNFYKIDENNLVNRSTFQQKSISEIYRDTKFPTKSKLKGIIRHDFIKEQIRRIILKQIYLK